MTFVSINSTALDRTMRAHLPNGLAVFVSDLYGGSVHALS